MPMLTRRSFTTSLLAGVSGLAAAGLVPPGSRARSLVIGGGPAGAMAALALRRSDPRAEVLLVERDPTRLGTSTAGAFEQPGAGVTLSELDAEGVGVLLDEAAGIDWRTARLELFSGRTLAFDRIVLAPGTAAVAEAIPGLDAVTRHRWPAAWGSTQEARRLAAQLGALPERGHVVLRLPAEISHPEVALDRALLLSAWLRRARPAARLTVLDGSDTQALSGRFHEQVARRGGWLCAEWQRARVTAVDARQGLIETDAGRLRAEVVNFVTPRSAGPLARVAGLADASGWCPCDASGRSLRRAGAVILGDARKGARRTLDQAAHVAGVQA
ncbi:FAD-dependent oxidoreductase [Alloyangia pacifica]|uniref:Pyridine nucleotide-disulphide oxidoreductase n=1 Tax=Alloyangia pacifica TaxID=311180 RepID=A0A1I6QT13_9RHOB|nr:FAD-dependent oxidoreductase [Alloyangia pacifica]SDF98059.1 Pyridine nucleotide-disulphide oxidoreductase [Alloyangia pacifica]SFS55581.1 Pyridine nucleotide-disulphide oxidoreductase [Alloyangia pacifica]